MGGWGESEFLCSMKFGSAGRKKPAPLETVKPILLESVLCERVTRPSAAGRARARWMQADV